MVNSNKTILTEDINQTTLVTFSNLLIISQRLEVFSRSLTLIAFFVGLIAGWCLNSIFLDKLQFNDFFEWII